MTALADFLSPGAVFMPSGVTSVKGIGRLELLLSPDKIQNVRPASTPSSKGFVPICGHLLVNLFFSEKGDDLLLMNQSQRPSIRNLLLGFLVSYGLTRGLSPEATW